MTAHYEVHVNHRLDQLIALLLNKIVQPCLILDANLRVRAANQAFGTAFDVAPEHIQGSMIFDVAAGQWNLPGLQVLLEKMLDPASRLKNIEVGCAFPSLGRRIVVLNRHDIADQVIILLTVEDVSSYTQAEALLHQAYDELEQRVQERTVELTAANALLKQEIAERERVEAALKMSEAHFAGMFEIAVDAIICLDDRQRIFLFNKGAGYIFGYSAAEAIGQPLSVLLPAHYLETHQRHVQGFVESQGLSARPMHERGPIWAQRKDGTEFPAQASISKLELNGEVILTVILRDITEQKRLEDSLRTALNREREISERRSRFISMVSHELRTPLAIMLSASQMLEHYGHRLSESRKMDDYEHIRQPVKHLTELLEDTLVVSRAETVGLEFDPHLCDLEAFCRALAERMQLTAQPNHELIFHRVTDVEMVQVDGQLLRQILTNLLSNAVKYSPKGGCIILELDGDADTFTLRVRDQGIGIPASDQKRLFESFFRGENVGTIPGTGLGLAIVREAVKAHTRWDHQCGERHQRRRHDLHCRSAGQAINVTYAPDR